MENKSRTEAAASGDSGPGPDSDGGPAPRNEPAPGTEPAPGPDPDDLAERYRGEFPILASKAYLNSNSLGALSRRSLEARRAFEEDWNEMGAAAWADGWMEKLEEVRAGFARTVGADPSSVALVPSISAGLTAVADALDLGAAERPTRGDRGSGAGARGAPHPGGRRRVVVTELDFPTLTYQFLARRRRGVEVEMLESPDGVEVPLEVFEEAVDGRTALVATSHVFFTTGAIQDAAEIARIAHDAGALFLLDAYQSHGQVPLDIDAVDADFLLSGALKWMMGGPGLAFLYVRPELATRLEPASLSWFGVEGQFDFDPRRAEPRGDARRFEMGTPAVGAAFTASGGLEIVEEIGVPAIRERNAMLAEDLLARLREAGYRTHAAPVPERRSAIVLARHPEPQAAVSRLARDGVVADARPGLVRFSPHFYNTVEDNVRAVESLEAV